jgi:Tfp pilus assembly protein PilN
MIRINLLPPEQIKVKRDRFKIVAGPSSATPIVVIILVLVYLVVGGFGYWVYKAKKQKDDEIKKLTSDRDKLTKTIKDKQAEFKELMETKTLLANQLEILSALNPPDRLFWAEKMNMLADVVPKNVFLQTIEVTEEIYDIETNESKANRAKWVEAGSKGPSPPVVKKPVITQTLSVAGITWADDPEQRLQLIIRFHDAMKSYSTTGISNEPRRFMDNFEDLIRIDPTYVGAVAGRTITHFKLILKTKPFTSAK